MHEILHSLHRLGSIEYIFTPAHFQQVGQQQRHLDKQFGAQMGMEFDRYCAALHKSAIVITNLYKKLN